MWGDQREVPAPITPCRICDHLLMDMSANHPFGVQRAYVSLGANLGDARGTLRRAVDELGELGRVAGVSALYETDPVGLEHQPAFTNAVAVLDTQLPPRALLDGLHRIEARHGRVRHVRWGPRTLDLDLIWYEGETSSDATLTLPHPRAHEREFVLRPLADVAPDLALAGSTVERLLAVLPPQGVRRVAASLMEA
jgi:2-amino-4-hydroxy-6-hydroxymethyldihydropteridine diphosphokinase